MTMNSKVKLSLIVPLLLLFAWLLSNRALAGVVISEVMAQNDGGLRDVEGDTPDWIEIHNSSTTAVNLTGWHLTDTPTNLARWTVPATNLAAGGFLVVFASGKDRAVSGAELHANFQLDQSGEYLALVQPDGATVAHALAPTFPPQRANVSFGMENNWSPVLSLDFNDDDSGEIGQANTEAGFSTMTLSSNPSTFNGITVTLSPLGGTTLDDRDRAVPVETATLTQDQLYDDVIYATGTTNGAGLRIRLTGLRPNQDYYVKIWSIDPGASTVGDRLSDWIETASGTTNVIISGYAWNLSNPPTQDGQNTFGGFVRASALGELQIEGRRSGGVSTTVDINALQLFEIGNGGEQWAWRYFSPSTPGGPNGTGYQGLVGDTRFSVDRGFYSVPFTVGITCATANAQVYWTTNGSAPSPATGLLYTGPIPIGGTTLLRAAAFLAGYLPSDVDTHSYLFLSQVLQQPANPPGYPTAWQASYPADYEMDPNVVHHPKYGLTLSNDLQALPIVSIVAAPDDLWGAVNGIYNHATSIGPQWERSASVELFQPDGHTEFAVNCGIEMQGNASRDNVRTPKHSFRLKFKSQYGPTKLRYPWFRGPVDQFDTIVLRASGFADAWTTRYSDTTPIGGTPYIGSRYRPETALYLRDTWVKDTLREMGHLSARSDFVHLYLNGLYWGIYNPSERLDAAFFASHLGGREWDWDVLAGDENYNIAEVRDGNRNDWDQLMALVNAGVTTETSYQAVAQLVDIENLIDYMLVHIFAEAEDWPHHNWYAAHRRATNGLAATRWVFLAWDQEIVLDRLVRRDRVNVNNTDTPALIYAQLRAYPEFRRLFGDRVHKYFFNNGILIPSNNIVRFQARAAQIDRAMVGESARWGDAREFAIGVNPGTGQTFTRDEWWGAELQGLYTNLFPTLTATNLERLRANSLYPSLGAPQLSQFGGSVPAGFGLTLTHTNASGAIFYTLDGSDPRQYGTGAVAPAAQAYQGPISFNTSTLVRARVFSNGQWSALVEAAFYPPQDLSHLTLTEIMYNPPSVGLTDGDEFEFVELKNCGSNPLNLSGLTFSQGISFTFTNGTLIAPGQIFVLARNAAAFAAKYPGVALRGLYTGKLDNGGEPLTLAHPNSTTALSVSYGDTAPWPVTPDGLGFSLVPRNPGLTQAPDKGSQWRASSQPGGSPGADDPPSSIPPIVINEVLTHTDPPQLDAIELFNPTATNVNVWGWYLTDDAAYPWKYCILTNTLITPGGYVVFDASQFNPTPGTNTSFAFNSTGDAVYLFSAGPNSQLSGYSHGVVFGAAFNGVSFGRYVNEVEEEFYPPQVSITLGRANSGPRIGPLVINEIQYHPAAGHTEFIELLNLASNRVGLFDPLYPTNTWRVGGASYSFPTNTSVGPNGLLLLVATNPATFRAQHSVPLEVPIYGPFAGTLQDSGETLELQAPDTPNTNAFVPYVVVEEVRYNDKAPWPAAADGSGLSLQRITASAYGNSPSNWLAATPTPGRLVNTADTDSDGLPDMWEVEHRTNPFLADANADPDGDGLSTWQEYLAGTDPQSAQSSLKLEAHLNGPKALALQFLAVSNRSYSLFYKPALQATVWTKLADVPAQPTNGLMLVPDLLDAQASRFYRLVTPAQP